MEKMNKQLALILILIFTSAAVSFAEDELKVIDTTEPQQQVIEEVQPLTKLSEEQAINIAKSESRQNSQFLDPMRYTLGPEDVVQVDVYRHPEFSGIYPVNLEGKIQLKLAGDIDVTGLTKKELEDKIKQLISIYVISPEVQVTVTEYKSKVIYVLGEVGQPGKYYMRSEAVPVREAVVNAGLPTVAAAMRRCRLITPDKNGKVITQNVDLYSILYGGNLQKNIEMKPGDVLYVPATIMAKVIRVINPVTSAVGVSTQGPENVSAARNAVNALVK